MQRTVLSCLASRIWIPKRRRKKASAARRRKLSETNYLLIYLVVLKARALLRRQRSIGFPGDCKLSGAITVRQETLTQTHGLTANGPTSKIRNNLAEKLASAMKYHHAMDNRKLGATSRQAAVTKYASGYSACISSFPCTGRQNVRKVYILMRLCTAFCFEPTPFCT